MLEFLLISYTAIAMGHLDGRKSLGIWYLMLIWILKGGNVGY